MMARLSFYVLKPPGMPQGVHNFDAAGAAAAVVGQRGIAPVVATVKTTLARNAPEPEGAKLREPSFLPAGLKLFNAKFHLKTKLHRHRHQTERRRN